MCRQTKPIPQATSNIFELQNIHWQKLKMKRWNKHIAGFLSVALLLLSSNYRNVFSCGGSDTCRSAHTGVTMGGQCYCEEGFCAGAIEKKYIYECVGGCSASGGRCKSNGTRNGITGYEYPCIGVGCFLDPDCTTYQTHGTAQWGQVLNCSCKK